MKLRRAIALFRGEREFHFDIIGHRNVWFGLSGVLIAASLIGLFVLQLNLSIDFRGGALLTYENRAGLTTEEIRAELEDLDRGDAIIQFVEGDTVTVRTETLGEDRGEVLNALAEQAGIEPSAISVEDIGPKWGQQISAKALQGLIIFLVLVSLYISFRFEWKMALASLAALFHDLVITAGVYALVGREVTPETVIAILTILGYSLYDNVVILDKIKENADSLSLVSRETYSGVVNLSLNQVLMRSLNTSVTSLLPIGALMLFGGETLENFAFALFVGMIAGTYSSIFVAAPVLALLKEREPRMVSIRERALRRAPRPALRPVPATGPSETAVEAEAPDLEPVVARPAARPAGRPSPGTARRKPKKKPRSKRRRR
ncbi:MAG TPA: protein translocase subunit SecF [Actinomycetota bacterium]|nr:protein translocase subunit SecF [Actinomycetota bacterium]